MHKPNQPAPAAIDVRKPQFRHLDSRLWRRHDVVTMPTPVQSLRGQVPSFDKGFANDE